MAKITLALSRLTQVSVNMTASSLWVATRSLKALLKSAPAGPPTFQLRIFMLRGRLDGGEWAVGGLIQMVLMKLVGVKISCQSKVSFSYFREKVTEMTIYVALDDGLIRTMML